LKRILPILTMVLLTAFYSNAQERRDPPQDASQRIMKLYPNPAVSFIKFDFEKNYERNYSLQIINFIGKQVSEIKNINPSSTIDLSSYTRGVYIYQLKDRYGKLIESGKFQVSK
jgi:Secretion system C-terminal sorting domain